MEKKTEAPLYKLVLGGLMGAVILLLTIVVAVPIPGMAGAYVNLGDAGVYLAAFLLGPFGALAAGIGSMLADLLLGSALYALPTLCIKGGMALLYWALSKKTHRAVAMLIAGALVPVGYFLFEATLYGAATAALGIPANLIQWAVGVLLGLPVLRIAQRLNEQKNGGH